MLRVREAASRVAKAGAALLSGFFLTGCSTMENPAMRQADVPFFEKDFLPDAVAEKAPWAQMAPQLLFSKDWQGKENFPDYKTEVRLCWSKEFLYVLWIASYDELHTAANVKPEGRGETWGIWNGDAVEMFIGDSPDPKRYFEFIVSPLDQWIDVRHNKNLAPELSYDASWESGWKRAVRIDSKEKRWIAEWRIPLGAITTQAIGADKKFRGNFYRMAGRDEKTLLYMAWSPTMSRDKPSFHVPERFGTISLRGNNAGEAGSGK